MSQPNIETFTTDQDLSGLITLRVADDIDSVRLAQGITHRMAIECGIKQCQKLMKELKRLLAQEEDRQAA